METRRWNARSSPHYFLSRYSPGTSSCGTSCVRTSASSASPASSTPFTASASKVFPSSSNSSTLSESAPWTLDNPCKSPDCSPDRAIAPSSALASVSTRRLFLRTCFLTPATVLSTAVFLAPTFVFASILFGAAFFFAMFFLEGTLFDFFIGATLLPADCLFLVFSLVAIHAVYHRPVIHRARASGDLYAKHGKLSRC